MAVHLLCAVRDSASGLFGRPNQFVNLAVAHRAFQQEVRSPDSGALNTNPEDFELYQIGTYEDTTGTLSPFEQPQMLARGKDVQSSTF